MELTTITFDALDPGRLTAFWAAVTGRQLAESTPDVAILTSATEPVRLLFLKDPRGRPAKTGCISTSKQRTGPPRLCASVGSGRRSMPRTRSMA